MESKQDLVFRTFGGSHKRFLYVAGSCRNASRQGFTFAARISPSRLDAVQEGFSVGITEPFSQERLRTACACWREAVLFAVESISLENLRAVLQFSSKHFLGIDGFLVQMHWRGAARCRHVVARSKVDFSRAQLCTRALPSSIEGRLSVRSGTASEALVTVCGHEP
jgi:hypothetical protein